VTALSPFRRDKINGRKICSITARVAGEQWHSRDGGVCADEEIGQYAAACAAVRAISLKYFAGEEKSGPWNFREPEPCLVYYSVNLLDSGIADREFSIDHRVNKKRAPRCGGIKVRVGPFRPSVVVRRDVEQDVRIDERYRSPRVKAMIWSVVRRVVAVPFMRRNRLGVAARAPTLCKKARPSSPTSKSTFVPLLMPSRSRTRFGMVTWPLLVTRTVMA